MHYDYQFQSFHQSKKIQEIRRPRTPPLRRSPSPRPRRRCRQNSYRVEAPDYVSDDKNSDGHEDSHDDKDSDYVSDDDRVDDTAMEGSSSGDSDDDFVYDDFSVGQWWYIAGKDQEGCAEPWLCYVYKTLYRGIKKGVHVMFLERSSTSPEGKYFSFSVYASGRQKGKPWVAVYPPHEFSGKANISTIEGDPAHLNTWKGMVVKKDWDEMVRVVTEKQTKVEDTDNS